MFEPILGNSEVCAGCNTCRGLGQVVPGFCNVQTRDRVCRACVTLTVQYLGVSLEGGKEGRKESDVLKRAKCGVRSV